MPICPSGKISPNLVALIAWPNQQKKSNVRSFDWTNDKRELNKQTELGGSPGLLVMGGGSCSKGRGFESGHRIPDGHDIFSCMICCKNCNDVCLKRPKINQKEGGFGPFFLKKTRQRCLSCLPVNLFCTFVYQRRKIVVAAVRQQNEI